MVCIQQMARCPALSLHEFVVSFICTKCIIPDQVASVLCCGCPGDEHLGKDRAVQADLHRTKVQGRP